MVRVTRPTSARVRSVLRRPRVLVSVAALAVCVAVPTVLVHHDYIRTVLWGGAILVSAVGWGAIVARRLYGDDARVGWGLEAALGMAVHLALGGLLAMLSLVSVTTSYVAVTLGVALFALEACRRAAAEAAPPGSDSRKGTGPGGPSIARGVVVVFFGVALLHYLGMAAERPANIIDDFQAYFSFPKQLLATGTLIEPFSSRRIFAYGGQSYLQALVLAFSTVFRIGLLDNGICVLVLAGLVVGWVRERPRFPVAVAIPALLGLLTLHYYDLNHNAASEFSGAVFFLAMFRVLDRPRRAGESAWANALALALVASAACTLRQSNLAAAALIPAAYYGLRMVRERDARRRWALEAALAALFSLALLLPWMVMTYRSCGTPLYPLIVGNGAQNLLSSGPNPISDAGKARYFITASLYPGRLPGLLLAFTAGLLVPSRASFALRASLAGTALAIIMLFNALAIAHLIDATDRYLFPYGLAYFLAASLIVTGAVAHPRRSRPLRDRHGPSRRRAGTAAGPDAGHARAVLLRRPGRHQGRAEASPPIRPRSRRSGLCCAPAQPSRSTRRSSSCWISLFVSTSSETASFRGMSQASSAPRLTYPSARAQTPWLDISSARASATSPTATGRRQSTFRAARSRLFTASAKGFATLPTATAVPRRSTPKHPTESLPTSRSSPPRGNSSTPTTAPTSSTLPRPRPP